MRWARKGKGRMPGPCQATAQPWSTLPLHQHPWLPWSPTPAVLVRPHHLLSFENVSCPPAPAPSNADHRPLSVAPASQAALSGVGSLRPLGRERGPSWLPAAASRLLLSPEHSSPKLQAGPETSPGPVPSFLETFSTGSLLQSPTHTTVLGDLTIHTADTSHSGCAESSISPFPPSCPLSHLNHLLPCGPQTRSP